MLSLLTLLLGAATADPELDGRHPEAVEVFACNFDESTDINHDGWPDHWKRHRSTAYPAYVNVEITGRKTQDEERCLQVDMNGGGALVHSPPIPISPLFSYVLEAEI